MVAPPEPFMIDPMEAIQNARATWVALIPYAYSDVGSPELRYNQSQWQWWGERPEGILESIRLAQAKGFKILLKPQVYIHRSWVGEVEFDTEEEWQRWERSYREYLMLYVDMAISEKVDMICIATEYNHAAIKRESYFRTLISDIRKRYPGKLCYSANWDHYTEIPFWDALDYIGISAYFPLDESQTPAIKAIEDSWNQHLPEMEALSKKWNKPILFSEFGYLSVDGCAGKGWEIEKQVDRLAINQTAQANAYEALFRSLWDKPWWAGGFVWKWFPNGEGHEGYPEKDYTPQNKKAEQVLVRWYGR
ncbi:MAG TPA: hypothetical protein VFX48_05195 [Saprospiraceae bacterium]|nr:hypothetical protein [Saprospiraceae bacterium]